MINLLGPFPKARVAVSLLFFGNGLIYGAWTIMIPAFKARLALSESELGFVILALGIGSIVSMPIVGALISKFGTRVPIFYNSIIFAFGLPLLTIAPSFIMSIVIMFVFGVFLAGMDVAMNSNAIEVERRFKMPIMSSCHGFWSLGGTFGATLGGLSLAGFGETSHAIIFACAYLALLILALLRLETGGITDPDAKTNKLRLPKSILPVVLGIVAFFSVVPEGVVVDWGALYLHEDRKFPLAMAGYGFAAFSTAMAIMRFSGDAIRQKFGSVRTLQVCSAAAIVGFLIIAFSSSPIFTILGFFIAGLGLSNIFPISISAAGNLPNIPSGIAVSIVTTVGYSGLLLAPPLFGFVAEIWSYSLIFMIMPVCLLVVFFSIYPARYADMNKDHTS